jgi:hypothetical protein
VDRQGRPTHKNGVAIYSNADGSSIASVTLADGIRTALGFAIAPGPVTEQRVGVRFAEITQAFLYEALSQLGHLLPGAWFTEVKPSLARIAEFDQYEHLDEIRRLAAGSDELDATLGGDYLVNPDIVLGRHPFKDAEINKGARLVGEPRIGPYTPLRYANARRPMLLATISCKWTIRSDRAQNVRTEAQNLIRNRKGKTPHIAFVTFEPLPSRLESIAMGLGDVDCAYHVALGELEAAATAYRDADVGAKLRRLIDSRRLRDISDLPFDLIG